MLEVFPQPFYKYIINYSVYFVKRFIKDFYLFFKVFHLFLFQILDKQNNSVYNSIMTNAQKVKMAIAYKNTSQKELADAIGTSTQNLSQKISRDTLSTAELEKIAAALGGVYVSRFEFPDGTKI